MEVSSEKVIEHIDKLQSLVDEMKQDPSNTSDPNNLIEESPQVKKRSIFSKPDLKLTKTFSFV